MPSSYVKVGVITLALVVLVVEAYLFYPWYQRYFTSDTAPEAASGSAPAPRETDATAQVPSDADTITFTHTATDENTRNNFTYIADPAIDGDPNAVVLVEPSPDQAGGAYDHNVGVWYEPRARKWAIFNQDITAMSAGATFEVTIPPADERFVHRAGVANIVGNSTYLDDPLTNGRPDAVLSVTQNWNPGGGTGVYNDHPRAIFYDEDVDKWAIYNEDGAPMPDGAAFNVAVSGSDDAR